MKPSTERTETPAEFAARVCRKAERRDKRFEILRDPSASESAKNRAAAQLVATERFAWPGGYLLLAIMSDGAALCPDCVKDNYREIAASNRAGDDDGWRTVGFDTFESGEAWETCAHCSRLFSTL